MMALKANTLQPRLRAPAFRAQVRKPVTLRVQAQAEAAPADKKQWWKGGKKDEAAKNGSAESAAPGGPEYFSTADPRLSGQQVQEILGCFANWNAALASGDPEKVADLYAEDGVLLPTVSNEVRSTREGLVDYFTAFLKLQPQGVIDEYGIRQEAVDVNGESSVISNSGIYTFTFGADGRQVQARFTYVYKKVGVQWKILSHHSSQLPSQLKASPFTGKDYISESTVSEELTEAEKDGVLAAFYKWNSALKTLDPEQVVACYAHDAILLPTVADDVRTTVDERRSYFIDFLKNKPQGELDEYHIRLIGRDGLGLPNAVSNQGIYTFDLKAAGKKVQARYTYNYVREGDRWLIKKHHSSAMPEATQPELPPVPEYFSTADPRLSGEQVKNVLGLFEAWNNALASGDPEKVADMYADNGVLLPTVSNAVRSTRQGLVDYFTAFLKLKPQGVIDEYGIREEAVDANGESTVISNSGIYTFTFGVDGRKVQARFTYVYKKVNDEWKILHHHSSQLPSQLKASEFTGKPYLSTSSTDPELTGAELEGVLAAFYKWNSALKTLDPEQVVDCYAQDAVLLPTVADDVRTTKDERRQYFIDFLKNQPQGELDEYHIRLIGRDDLGLPSAVSNQGIYTFEMGTSGKKVQARYTFNYVREGGRWLIKKHHSSAMPEATALEA